MTGSPVVKVGLAAGAIFFVGTGAWAFVSPRSFYDTLATYPPYHVHFLHDIGAFTIGIGAALLLALRFRDSLLVALGGATTASVFHAVAHAIDADRGGKSTDPWTLGAFALLLVVATVVRAREVTDEGSSSGT